MKLSELTGKIKILERKNWKPALEVSGISSHSRRVGAGEIFVACPGPHTDGHQFIEEASTRGARIWVGEKAPLIPLPENAVFLKVPDAREALGLLLDRFYGSPSRKLKLVGITGTNGKTTSCYLLHHLLNSRIPSALIGTLGYQSPKGRQILANTTPGAEELFRLLADAVEEGVKTVVMEVSSHALHQRRVHGLEFELAVFTQLSPEHLDYHRTLEEYFSAKRLLFSRPPLPHKMLVNQDSPYGRRLLGEFPRAKSFSLKDEADYRVRDITTGFQGSKFIFSKKRRAERFETGLPLTHNVANLAVALASLDLLGFDPADFHGALLDFPGVPGRLERIEGNGFTVFVDYAHTPDAFENILSEARQFAPKRVLTLFGCGGDRDPFKRPEMTRIAYHYSDLVILTSDNPRTEDPEEIIREMRRGLPSAAPLPNVSEILDRREAIAEVLALAEPGDVVFILGKGHEDYQILGTKKIHFDDREVVRECLNRKSRVVL